MLYIASICYCCAEGGIFNLPIQIMNWTEFLALAASAGLLSAAFSAGVSAFGTWWSRRRHARYLALRVAVQMDAYFHACLDRLSEMNAYNASGGHHGQQHFSVPLPPEPPADDTGWVNLDPKLSDRALSFGVRVDYMNGAIRDDLEIDAGPPEDADTSRTLTHLYETAQDAYLLAQDLRHEYDFKLLEHSRSSYEWLLEAKERHAAVVLEREERQRKAHELMWRELSKISPEGKPVSKAEQTPEH